MSDQSVYVPIKVKTNIGSKIYMAGKGLGTRQKASDRAGFLANGMLRLESQMDNPGFKGRSSRCGQARCSAKIFSNQK